ncbi:hypothetical protein GQ44DRAFT_832320 [Phaeosphaeriaceae sp. PMI808]|nr:hypothetical protein GQ44DRAFT_832320 [Phaeosphaeriaceae sp. PMI808]
MLQSQNASDTDMYFNASCYDPSCMCVSIFEADPDISGPGPMTSFIGTSWLTIVVALIPVYDELCWCIRERENPFLMFDHRSMGKKPPLTTLVRHARKVLDALCDLQLITGTSILIAGLVQIKTISFYHQNFVLNYWWLTLNSFWAARAGYTMEDTQMEYWRLWIRRFSLFVSSTLSVVFQFHVILREKYEWGPLRSGYCYVSHDRSADANSWIWASGTALYALALLLSLSEPTMKWVKDVSEWQMESVRTLFNALPTRFNNIVAPKLAGKTGPWYVRVRTTSMSVILLLAHSFITVVTWLLVQFIAIWSYGIGFYALEVSIYIAFSAWDTWNLIDWKISNRILTVPQGPKENVEGIWGFGQVLSLAVLYTIVLQMVDIIRESS